MSGVETMKSYYFSVDEVVRIKATGQMGMIKNTSYNSMDVHTYIVQLDDGRFNEFAQYELCITEKLKFNVGDYVRNVNFDIDGYGVRRAKVVRILGSREVELDVIEWVYSDGSVTSGTRLWTPVTKYELIL